MRAILGHLPKWLLFAFLGAIGGILGAAFGEIVFLISQPHREPSSVITPTKAICLLIDCSGSMGGAKLTEVKRAASSFATRQDLARDRLAVLGFESSAHLVCDITGDLATIESGISQLSSKGGTGMAEGLRAAGQALSGTPHEQHILLFTDGMPDSKEATLTEAKRLRSHGIGIIAVATTDADRSLLTQLTGDRNRVMTVDLGSFDSAFRWADSVIRGGVVDHMSGPGGIIRTTAWAACLAVFIALLLVVAQNAYLRRRLLPARSVFSVVAGGTISGALAGATGEYTYSGIGVLTFFPRAWLWAGGFLLIGSLLGAALFVTRKIERLSRIAWKRKLIAILVLSLAASYFVVEELTSGDALPRILSLSLLGALLGFGLTFCVPNLKKRRGTLGGLLGGVVAGSTFVWFSAAWGDTSGRLSGGLVLGLCIGCAIALIESIWRKASLEVVWGPGNSTMVNLGDRPVLLGSGPKCHVYLKDAPPVAASIRIENGRILYEDKNASSTEELADNAKKTYGALSVVIHATH